MKLIFNDEGFSFRLLGTIGKSAFGGSDIGECLSTAYRIEDGDFESWYKEWLKTAEMVEKIADESIRSGHNISAKEAYLRASTYYAEAEFYLHTNSDDPRILQTYDKATEIFKKASKFFYHGFEPIEVPYLNNSNTADTTNGSNTTLPGFLYTVDAKKIQRPIIIISTGFDGIQESLYHSNVLAALSRGYNCLTIEGPGQGRVIRKQGLPFRPDWEKVVTPFIDFLLSQKKSIIDERYIALLGISMGGYLAPRATAYDNRITACIANDGVLEVSQSFTSSLPPLVLKALNEGNKELFNSVMDIIISFSPQAAWGFSNGMWVFDAESPFALIKKSYTYSLGDEDLSKINCPSLILDAEQDIYYKDQAKMLYDKLRCKKDYIQFTKEEGAEIHCHSASLYLLNQRIFDWLDGVFEINQPI